MGTRHAADGKRVPAYLGGVAAAVTLVAVVEAVNRIASGTGGMLLTPAYLVSFGITLPFVVTIAYGAWYLADEPFPPARNRRILGWCVAASGLWTVANLLTMAVLGFTSTWVVIAWIRGAVAFGFGTGLVVGVMEARAVTQAVAAEQARLRAEHAARQRDLVDYVNSLLRHEVLNGVNVVQGNAQLLAESDDAPDRHVDPILRRSEELQTVVREVRTVVESLDADGTPEATDLADAVRTEATKAADLVPDATVTVDVPEETTVYGDNTIGPIVGNLLENAVRHGGEAPHVRLSGSVDGDYARLRVADDGPGIADHDREGLFERPASGTGDHGYGLYLVDVLCEQTGGSVELVETGPDGTVFEVTLPRADAADSFDADGALRGTDTGDTALTDDSVAVVDAGDDTAK
ncbi:sensor histidine kinase [Halobaculum sp. MBLA0143]|uniref:sensor histidine kinase n=1 Tax=Halobaculum sp. MBLA0143 TaxID=3079933 RepID=UPI0035240A3A